MVLGKTLTFVMGGLLLGCVCVSSVAFALVCHDPAAARAARPCGGVGLRAVEPV